MYIYAVLKLSINSPPVCVCVNVWGTRVNAVCRRVSDVKVALSAILDDLEFDIRINYLYESALRCDPRYSIKSI